jgi:hypothetical protein
MCGLSSIETSAKWYMADRDMVSRTSSTCTITRNSKRANALRHTKTESDFAIKKGIDMTEYPKFVHKKSKTRLSQPELEPLRHNNQLLRDCYHVAPQCEWPWTLGIIVVYVFCSTLLFFGLVSVLESLKVV